MSRNHSAILVTGGAGYVGSVLVRRLLERGDAVAVVDTFAFGEEPLAEIRDHPRLTIAREDLRDPARIAPLLQDARAVVHLAAIVGDPACAKRPALAQAVNWDAAKALFDLCAKTPSVRRFVFASTCSNYGKMKDVDFVTEASPLTPVSLYARLKVRFEQYILEAGVRDDLAATALRFATVCGASPRMRFDLTVNEFARDLALGRPLEVFGGQFWRPYCHVGDIARACLLVLDADAPRVRREVFGVGGTRENYTKTQIAERLKQRIPGAQIRFVHKDEDPRDYRVDFSKIESKLGFRVSKTLDDSIDEILAGLRGGVWKDPDSPRYRNV